MMTEADREIFDLLSKIPVSNEEIDLVRDIIARTFLVPTVFITPRKDRKPRLVWTNPNLPVVR